MATKRADQRRITSSLTLTPSMFNAVREVAHIEGKTNTSVAVEAIYEYLTTHYPAIAEGVQK